MNTKVIEAGARADLLPCPFCGGEPDIRTRQDEDIWTHNTVTWTGVNCMECGMGFEWPPGAEPTAIEQWNTRASGALVPAALAAERERCLQAVYDVDWNAIPSRLRLDIVAAIRALEPASGDCVLVPRSINDAQLNVLLGREPEAHITPMFGMFREFYEKVVAMPASPNGRAGT